MSATPWNCAQRRWNRPFSTRLDFFVGWLKDRSDFNESCVTLSFGSMIDHEQRRNPRFDVHLPCELWSPFRAFDTLSGVTVNMSRVGLLFSPEQDLAGCLLPQVGHAARVVLQLTGSGQESARCVECLGRVVRLEEEESSRRIALEFRRYQFTDHPAGAART